MKLFQEKELDLKITVGLVIAVFSAFWLLNLYRALSVDQTLIFPYIVAAVFIAIAVGLFFLNLQSLVFAQFIFYLGIVVSIIGFINPFMAGDLMVQGVDPPSGWYLLAVVSPFILVMLWCLHIMGKYKSRFK